MSDRSTVTRGKGIPLRDEENSLELELTLDGEVLDSEMVFPIVGQALVEGAILFRGDVLRVARPKRLGLVELLVGNGLLLDGLLLLLGLVVVVFDFLDLGLIFAFIFLGFFLFIDFL